LPCEGPINPTHNTIDDERIVYKASQGVVHGRPTATLLRLSF
jgi:hypothetical protein